MCDSRPRLLLVLSGRSGQVGSGWVEPGYNRPVQACYPLSMIKNPRVLARGGRAAPSRSSLHCWGWTLTRFAL